MPRDTDYKSTYRYLRKQFNQNTDHISLEEEGIDIFNPTFISENVDVLPGANEYTCDEHNLSFSEQFNPRGNAQIKDYHPSLYQRDCEFESNRRFRITIFQPADISQADRVILLTHGLNERYWGKYLPWALKLARQHRCAVILFPIAFHMNRAPAEWSNPRQMKKDAKLRKQHFNTINASSFANTPISVRLQMYPQRFFWSGLQTYNDVRDLLQMINNGEISTIQKGAHIDLFAYSIGAFLSQILLLTNPNGHLTDSRLFIFCGGPTLDRLNPVSKYILDSQAMLDLYDFYNQHLNFAFEKDKRLAHFFNEHESGHSFSLMLTLQQHRKERESRYRELSDQIKAYVLERDEVIVPVEVLNTLNGAYRDIPIPVTVDDYDFDYSHINPFPDRSPHPEKVDAAFNKLFDSAGEFLA